MFKRDHRDLTFQTPASNYTCRTFSISMSAPHMLKASSKMTRNTSNYSETCIYCIRRPPDAQFVTVFQFLKPRRSSTVKGRKKGSLAGRPSPKTILLLLLMKKLITKKIIFGTTHTTLRLLWFSLWFFIADSGDYDCCFETTTFTGLLTTKNNRASASSSYGTTATHRCGG